MHVSLSLINRQNCALITGHLLSFCRREREDSHLVEECLGELRSKLGKYCRGPELLQQMIKLLKADYSKNPSELVRTFVKLVKREIVGERLRGPEVAKELFLALTVLPSVEESDDEVLSNASSSITASIPIIDSKPTTALMQATVWACGYWAWRGIVDESLCTSGDLIAFLIAIMGMNRSLRGFVLNALLRMAGQAEAGLIFRALKGEVMEEDVRMTILLLEQQIYPLDDGLDDGIDEIDDIEEEDIDALSKETASKEINSNTAQSINSAFGMVNVSVDQVIKSQGGVQVQFLIDAQEPVKDVSVALAVAKDYDFDYLQSASSTQLANAGDTISLAIVVKKRVKKAAVSVDLLDLLDEPAKPVSEDLNDINDCQLRMRIQYTSVESGETETHVSPITL